MAREEWSLLETKVVKVKKNDNINQIHDHIKQNFPHVVVLVHMGLYKCDNITRLITLSMITINRDHCTSWQPMLRYGESVFTKERQGTEFFVVVALLCKFWSTSKLCIQYIDICPRHCLHGMCAFKKRQKLPVVWKVFLQIRVKW